MKTAAYTICKNEIKFVEQWLYYTKDFDYRVLLDTGSTDGTYEALLEAQKTDANLIIEQKIFTPWKFNIARNYNLDMIPDDVDWCLSPDLDEYFSINVLDRMKLILDENPDVTNINCDRLDIYAKTVRVEVPTNKIHRKNDYHWVQPIYEHLWFKYHDTRKEVEIYDKEIFLIHDQDFKKKERPDLYLKMLKDEYESNPTNCWTLWYLVNHYYKTKDVDNFISHALVFVKYSQKDDRLMQVIEVLKDLYKSTEHASSEQKADILQALSNIS